MHTQNPFTTDAYQPPFSHTASLTLSEKLDNIKGMKETQPNRKSYGQYCGLARTLDVVGDRWTLLVVRELLIGPRRFGELQAGLDGVASNLLADRLKQMEQDGIVSRSLGEPGAGIRYALTTRGAELREGIEALIRWSTPLMVSGRGDQVVRASWLAVALPALLRSCSRSRRRVRILIKTCGDELFLTTGRAGSEVSFTRSDVVDAEIVAEPEVILGLAAGALDLPAARQLGAEFKGSRAVLAQVFGREAGESGAAPPARRGRASRH